MEKCKYDLFQFFFINFQAAPQLSAMPAHPVGHTHPFDTPMSQLCPGIAGYVGSCDSQLPTSGGGIHEKKSKKTESAEDQARSSRSGACQIGSAHEPEVT